MTPERHPRLRLPAVTGLFILAGLLAGTAPGQARQLPLERVAETLGAELIVARHNGYVTLRTSHHEAILIPEVRRVSLNGINVYLNGPLVKDARGLRLHEVDLETVLWPLFAEGTERPWPQDPLVVIDPGHGGTDGGAPGRGGLLEKEVALDIARRLQARLTQAGLHVRMTREDDRFLTLPQRTRLAREWRADLFVSIHLNASPNAAAHGVETFVLPAAGFPSTSNSNTDKREYSGNKHDAENTRLAYFIQKGLMFQTQADDRGVRRARFEVLRETDCPAVLVECGFLSHPSEARRLANGEYRDRIAQGVASGIFTYIKRRETGPVRESVPRSRATARPPVLSAPRPAVKADVATLIPNTPAAATPTNRPAATRPVPAPVIRTLPPPAPPAAAAVPLMGPPAPLRLEPVALERPSEL